MSIHRRGRSEYGEKSSSSRSDVQPGFETEKGHYLNTLTIVDDATPFSLEVQEIDLAKGGFSNCVFEDGVDGENMKASVQLMASSSTLLLSIRLKRVKINTPAVLFFLPRFETNGG